MRFLGRVKVRARKTRAIAFSPRVGKPDLFEQQASGLGNDASDSLQRVMNPLAINAAPASLKMRFHIAGEIADRADRFL